MATLDSPLTTYSDTTPQKRAITDVISLIDPVDTPTIAALGGLDGASGKFRFTNWPSTVYEWLEDTHLPLTEAMNNAATITSTIATITVTDGTNFQRGHIVMVDNEYMWVSSVATATNVLTVTRGVGGGTAATHDSIASISIIGMARVEGDDSSPIGFTDRYVGSNVTQILHQEVKVTRTQAKISQYGISDEVAYQRDKAIPNQMRVLERHLFYNKAKDVGSATAPRIMGGFQAFITTNKISGANLNQTAFESAVMSAYNNGGVGPYIAPCSPVNMQKIKNFYDNYSTAVNTTTILRVGPEQRSVGMKIEQVITPFGDVNLLLDRWTPNNIIPILNPDHVGLITYDPFGWEELAKTGDYTREEVIAEVGFCLRQEKAHAILTAVS